MSCVYETGARCAYKYRMTKKIKISQKRAPCVSITAVISSGANCQYIKQYLIIFTWEQRSLVICGVFDKTDAQR